MLVFISDLHFIDGTAGKHNIKPKAFDYFFDDLVAIAGKTKAIPYGRLSWSFWAIFSTSYAPIDGGCPVLKMSGPGGQR